MKRPRVKRGSCHDCAYEWADPCHRFNVHFPSDARACQDCRRNPNAKELPTGDHYVLWTQAIKEMVDQGKRG